MLAIFLRIFLAKIIVKMPSLCQQLWPYLFIINHFPFLSLLQEKNDVIVDVLTVILLQIKWKDEVRGKRCIGRQEVVVVKKERTKMSSKAINKAG